MRLTWRTLHKQWGRTEGLHAGELWRVITKGPFDLSRDIRTCWERWDHG